MSNHSAYLTPAGFSPVRVLIGDPDPAFRENLREVLKPHPGIEISGEAPDADSMIALTARLAPQVLLLDYGFCRRLYTHSPAAVRKIVVLEAPEKARIIDSFRLGAHGIVLKGSAGPIWSRSIETVVAGEYWLGNESLAVLIQAIRESASRGGTDPARHFGLTPREIEIVQRIADGRSNKEVGQDFSIRERTVKHHLTNIFGKVGVSSRLELALFARDHQLFAAPAPPDSMTAAEPEGDWLRTEEQPKKRVGDD